PWSPWSSCSLSCGSGTQWRNRSCVGPFYGGQNCVGDFNATQSCNVQSCPVDGYYKNWSDWGSCSVTCGGGQQYRQRSCVQPLYGGADCVGPRNETQACNDKHCPGTVVVLL
ncbi:unnamed protein product, partial [Lymnaea stagnalis]